MTRITYTHVHGVEFDSVRLADQTHPFDGPNDVTVTFGGLILSGDGYDLAGHLEQAAAAVRYALRRRAMESHPSFDGFNPEIVSDCEGSWMPDGAIYLTPTQAAAVAHINEAIDRLGDDDLTFEARTSSMMRERDVQAGELGPDAA